MASAKTDDTKLDMYSDPKNLLSTAFPVPLFKMSLYIAMSIMTDEQMLSSDVYHSVGLELNTQNNNGGNYGGLCTCLDGKEYWVGDNFDDCASLSCINGQPGVCEKRTDPKWANKGVTCGMQSIDDSQKQKLQEFNDMLDKQSCYNFFKNLVKNIEEKSPMTTDEQKFLNLSSTFIGDFSRVPNCTAEENFYPVLFDTRGMIYKNGGFYFCLPKNSCPSWEAEWHLGP